MFRLVPVLAALIALALPASARSGRPGAPCVGGPHCYSSLQQAVDAAADGDTIRVGPGTFAGGVVILRSVEVVGVAASATTIRGGGPVLTIGSATSTPTVRIEGLTISGGVTTSNSQAPHCGPDVPTCGPGYADATALGGGVEAFPGTTVTLDHSVVTGNISSPARSTRSVKAVCPGPTPCPAAFGDAAGIDNWGTMTLIGSTVSDNHASSGAQSNGGGIVDEAGATLVVSGSRVTGNSAAAVGAAARFVSGGGILVAGNATLLIEDSAVDGNRATLATSLPHPYPMQDGGTDQMNSVGGGIYVSDGSTATIRNSSIDGNAVTVTDAAGEPFGADAALCACGGVELTLEHARIEHNTLSVDVLTSADSGPSGPTALEADGETTISDTLVTDNASVVSAAGDAATLGTLAFFLDGTSTTIADSTIARNSSVANAPGGTATVLGGAISNDGPLLLRNDRISDNLAAANGRSSLAQGAGVWNGVLFGGPNSPLTLENTRVTANVLSGGQSTTLEGGGIFTPGFPLTTSASVVAHNTPDDCFGC